MDQQRDRINNPNFSSGPLRSPSYPSYQPSAPQPPPQQPPFDPFARPEQRRDPFLPAFGSRRDSLNGSSRPSNNYPSKDGAQQPPRSPFHSSSSLSYPAERRESTTDAGTSQSLQHPASLLNRHMPPPSSPRHSPVEPYSSSTLGGPLPSSLPRPRESSAPVPSHRSGRSMSIQSMMGSDTAPSSNPPTWASSHARSGPTSYTQPPSPRDRPYSSRGGMETDSLPQTPSRKLDGHLYHPFEKPEHSATSSPTAGGSQYQPPERAGHGLSRLLQSFPPPTSETNGAPSRPYSRPDGVEPAAKHPEPLHYESRQPAGAKETYGGGSFENAVRDRSVSDYDGKRGLSSTQQYPRPSHEPFSPVPQPSLPAHSTYQPRAHPEYRDPSLNGSDSRRDAEYRQPAPQSSNMSYPSLSTASNDATDRASFDGGARRSLEYSATSNPSHYSRQADSIYTPGRYPDAHANRTPPIDAQLRRSIEDSQRQSFSRLANDLSRPDRSSPLPQAVQGAQSQPAGSGRDPGIKSEFGRMFSGLGSGVGSTPQPMPPPTNGAPTPTRRSPDYDLLDQPESTGRRNISAETGLPKSGPGSRGGRRGGKRAIAENGKRDSDSGDGRSTPATASTRGTKRNRYMQQATGHHHHQHPAGHHHHHHHRKADDTAPLAANRPNATSYNSFTFPTPGPAPANTNVPHHHHHHHHQVPLPVPHHHHHPPKATPEARVKRPTTTISTSPLIKSISHLPRRHLGSQLYAPKISIPGASFSTVDAPAVYQTASDPNPLPRFDRSNVNSTFTIRVPRYYLTDSEREKICKGRRVWGTDVYTDDSDPLAAAFHSGWIRGAWGNDVDVSIILGLPNNTKSSTNGNATVNGDNQAQGHVNGAAGNAETSTITTPPADGPPVPPANRDLHLTVLLLPPLEKYTGSVWHGIKSRSWGENHDGLSFKIEKVEWVDEGVSSRWEERGLGAKKRRLGGGSADTTSSQQSTKGYAKKKSTGALGLSRVIGTVHAPTPSQVVV